MTRFLQLFGKFSSIAALVLLILAVIMVVSTGPQLFSALADDWAQLLVAGAAALTMFLIGRALTLGKGTLAGASQYDKLLVWSALGLSIVSAVTTATGLQDMLNANAANATLIPIVLAFVLGISIQAYMLNSALRIGEGIQRLNPPRAMRDEEDIWDEAEDEDLPRKGNTGLFVGLLSIPFLMLAGLAVTLNYSLVDLVDLLRNAVFSTEVRTGVNPVGLLFLAAALFVLYRVGVLYFVGSMAGLMVAFFVYLGMLFFSSGFGYMFYFTSIQTEEVQASDRNAFIRNETPALVNKIIAATEEDVRASLIEAREGENFNDLSGRMNRLAELFRNANQKIDEAKEFYRLRRLAQMTRQQAALDDLSDAKDTLATAKESLRQAKQEVDLQSPSIQNSIERLLPQRDDAIALRDAELTGDEVDGASGVAGRGPRYEANNKIVEDIQKEIDDYTRALSDLEATVIRAQSEVDAAQGAYDLVVANESTSATEEELPPEIVDPQSFIGPRDDYLINPSVETLERIAKACSAGLLVLINAEIDAADLPTCDIAAVEADLISYQRSQAALDELRKPDQTGACQRTDEELAADREGRLNSGPAELSTIPPYLRARVEWVVRCVDAANTGTEGVSKIVKDVAELESEYLTAQYDVRRIFSAITAGNDFAMFALVLALVVDTAILFAGIGANAQRGIVLREDHMRISPDRLADRIRRTLEQIDPHEPGAAAKQLLDMAELLPFVQGRKSPFTHMVPLANKPPELINKIKMVMTAAGTTFARYRDVDGPPIWLLHANVVALLTDMAGTRRASVGGSGSDSGGFSYDIDGDVDVSRVAQQRRYASRHRRVGLLPEVSVDSDDMNRGNTSPKRGPKREDPLNE